MIVCATSPASSDSISNGGKKGRREREENGVKTEGKKSDEGQTE